MAVQLEIMPADGSLEDFQKIIRQSEELGSELVSLAKCFENGDPGNMATFVQNLALSKDKITLQYIDSNQSIQDQTQMINDLLGEDGEVVCYSVVYMNGQEKNVMIYRD